MVSFSQLESLNWKEIEKTSNHIGSFSQLESLNWKEIEKTSNHIGSFSQLESLNWKEIEKTSNHGLIQSIGVPQLKEDWEDK